MTTTTNQIQSYLAENRARFVETSLSIHAKPEIGNEEYFACEQLTTLLREEGFEVETNVAGHETAFYAQFSSSKPGPTIAYTMPCQESAMLAAITLSERQVSQLQSHFPKNSILPAEKWSS